MTLGDTPDVSGTLNVILPVTIPQLAKLDTGSNALREHMLCNIH